MWRRIVIGKFRFRGRAVRGFRFFLGFFLVWKLGRGSERFKVW